MDGGGTVAADTEGHVYAVWHGNRETDGRGEDHRAVWIARSTDDGVGFAPEAMAWPARTGACGCCQARALATPPNGLTILYQSATNLTHRDIYVLSSNDGGATFAGSIVQPWELNACPMTSLSLAHAGSHTAAAWETAGQVFLGVVDCEAGRVRSIVAAPGSGAGRKHPRLAISEAGVTLMVWSEQTGWARGGSVAWQAFDAAGPTGATGSAPALAAWSFATAVARPDGGFVVLYLTALAGPPRASALPPTRAFREPDEPFFRFSDLPLVTTMPDHDERLALRCLLGEPAAFDELVARWHPGIWRYARRMAGNDHEADNLAQDVWLRVVRGLPRLEEPARIRAWIFGIARRVLMDRLRVRYATPVMAEVELDTLDGPGRRR